MWSARVSAYFIAWRSDDSRWIGNGRSKIIGPLGLNWAWFILVFFFVLFFSFYLSQARKWEAAVLVLIFPIFFIFIFFGERLFGFFIINLLS